MGKIDDLSTPTATLTNAASPPAMPREASQLTMPKEVKIQKKISTYHFVGIGGCGMSGLAQILCQSSQRVSGSDMESSSILHLLKQQGVTVNIGHDPSAIPSDVDFVVVSAAIQPDNPELLWARQHEVPVLKYAQMLGQVSRRLKTLAVAGTHGKSTTSGWMAYLLRQSGQEPNYVVGANVEQLGSGSGAGASQFMVVEACEYDRSLLNLQPWAAAVLNIEADHLDYYRDIHEIVTVFDEFTQLLGEDGLLVANADDANVAQITRGRTGRCEYFSLAGAADWMAEDLKLINGKGVFELVYRGRKLGKVALSLAGMHNVANSLAAAALAHEAGLEDEDICRGLESFTGVGRRMSFKAQVGGITVLDDYAHHPTEIKATLAAIKAQYQPRRLWCVFQPHQHSRTRFFLEEFALSFRQANIVLLPDIYFVRDSEQSRQEVNARQLAERINRNGGQAEYLGDFSRILEELCDKTKAGDVVITMGAGNIWKLADEFICRLRGNCQV